MSPKTSVFRKGNTALITGGASGIGLALAKKCRAAGMRVTLVDLHAENLARASRSVGAGTTTYAMDVGELAQWAGLKKVVEGEMGRIDLLALNAGMGLKGSWTDASYFHQVLQTNLFGVIHGITTFLPFIQSSATASNPSSIIITGSKQGITNPPGNPAYNASKAAVKSLAEGLSWELRPTTAAPDPPISVHLLVPGWTYTGLSGAQPGSTEGMPEGAWSPEQVVDYLLEKMDKRDFYVICPDNDVSTEMDRKRILWGAGDVAEGRQPLSRWRDEYKEEAEAWMKKA